MRLGRTALALALAWSLSAQGEPTRPGEAIEAEVRGDFDGDGRIDRARVTSDGAGELRFLDVSVSGKANERLALDPAPLGAATLRFANGVLIVADLTGGTTALATTRRYRFDSAAGRMRLIGLDVALYSRTFAHDGFELSWNLLTGRLVTRELRLSARGGDRAGYDRGAERMRRRPSRPLWLPETPDPETVLASARHP